MPLRFQNVCRHRQTNNTSRLPPILTPHTLFSHFPAPLLSNFPAFPENLLPAVFRRSSHRTRCFLTFLPRLFQTFPPFPKISCRPSSADPHTAHVVSSPFLPRFFQTFPPFPKISCQPSSADPHTAHVVFSLSCRASLKFAYLSRKSPAGRFMPPRTAHVVSSPFLPRFFQTFPPFPKISCRPSSADPHTAHVVFSLSCPASFKLSRLSRKSPAGRFTPPRTARVVSLLSGPVHRSPA